MSSPERINVNPEREHNPEALEKARLEQHEALREQLEKREQSHESLDEARHEALEKAQSIEKEKKPETAVERNQSPAERRGERPIGKTERDASFNTTMQEVQTHMSPASRTFSKAIHNKTVEKVSDITGNTIARPNAILSGAVFAFALTLAVYLVAKNIGYPLSGFETIGAFILGWALGIVYDFLKVMVTGRK